MLPAELDQVAAPGAGVEQQRESKAFARADGPARLEGRNVLLAPTTVAVALADLRPLHRSGGVGRDQLLLDREGHEAAERGQPCLLQMGREPREDGRDVLGLELPDRLVAVLGAEPLEVTAAVGARGLGESVPGSILVVGRDGRVDRARNCAACADGGHRRCGTVARCGVGSHERLAPRQPGQRHPLAPRRAVIEAGLAGAVDEAIYEGRVFRTSSHGLGSPRSPGWSGSLVSA
jgi:hypothetical protein